MEWQYTLFLVLAPLSGAAIAVMLLYARRFRDSALAETPALSWLVAAVVGWLVLNTAELIAASEAATLFWARTSYLFIVGAPLAWLAFACQYTGIRWPLARARFALLCAIPAITFLVAVSGTWARLLWQSYEFVPVSGLLAMRVVKYGPWFWVHASYAHALVLLGALLIGRHYFRSTRLFRRQSAWVVVGALIPIVANVVYLFHLVPGLTKDFTSVAMALSSIAFMVGICRYHLFDLRPIAREMVVDSLVEAMLTLDAQGRIVDLNPAARRLVTALHNTTAPLDLVGQPVATVLGPCPALVEHLAGSAVLQRDVCLDLEGGRRTYELQVSPLTGRGGRLAGRVVVLRDVTSRTQAEEQLRRYAEELEVQNEELDAFARTVAHDLKDPLATLISYSDYLHREVARLDPEQRLYCLNVIRGTSYAMSNIVDELLLLARVRRRTAIEMAPLDLEAVTVRALDRLARPLAETGAEIMLPDAWPEVDSYAPWVEEVWTNYLSNALRYGGHPEEGIPPSIELGYAVCPAPAAAIRFWVRDNGPGLSEQEQAQLFLEFTRLVRGRSGGSGLGLAIVRRIVEKLGGEVGVESEVGQGSLFWFTLPTRS